MSAANQPLKKAGGGIVAPQHYNPITGDYEVTQGANGASFVSIKNPPEDVTLQDASTASGNGTTFAPIDGNYTLTFEITGTSTSRTIVFELAGPSGQYMPITAFSVNDPTKFGQQTSGGSNSSPESWQVVVPAGYAFRARISVIAGGDVTVKGKAVT